MVEGRPIKPEEVPKLLCNTIPPEVFDVFNKYIALNYSNGGPVIVYQSDVVNDLVATGKFSRDEIFDKGYLNVEPAYRDNGWKVRYDKPAYNESYAAYFEFIPK